jgi:hypothetical protein
LTYQAFAHDDQKCKYSRFMMPPVIGYAAIMRQLPVTQSSFVEWANGCCCCNLWLVVVLAGWLWWLVWLLAADEAGERGDG